MELDLLNKISNLNIYGFYDVSKDMITVHFFNEAESKANIMAYLRKDMSWDVREIIGEEARLYSDYEEIKIKHSLVGIYNKDSDFDRFVRAGLKAIGKQIFGEDANLIEKDKMFEILNIS